MDATKPKTIQKIIRIGLVTTGFCLALLTACNKPPQGPYVSYSPPSGIFSCEIPSDWRLFDSKVSHLDASSPDDVGLISAEISISRERKWSIEKLKEDMAWNRKNWGDDDPAYFSQTPLKPFSSGEFKGWTYSRTRINALAAGMHHQETPPPAPVRYKETFIYVETHGKQYLIEYAAPTAIYDKHRPALDHLLETFRWTGG